MREKLFMINRGRVSDKNEREIYGDFFNGDSRQVSNEGRFCSVSAARSDAAVCFNKMGTQTRFREMSCIWNTVDTC